MQRETKQHRKHQYLQNVAAGESANHAAGDNIEQKCHDPLVLRLFGVNRHGLRVEGRRVNVHSRAGLHHVNDNQADDQRNGTHDFKIEQRHRAGAADGLHALHPGNPRHDGTEDNRGNNHFNQLNEGIAEGFHLRTQFRVKMAQQNTDRYGRENLDIKAFKERDFHRVSFGYNHRP
ncbi:Uncharacterised protein [Klebsiella pneumoniae]|nr:Uncharacterised protein [Klebsiella pneumoniae]